MKKPPDRKRQKAPLYDPVQRAMEMMAVVSRDDRRKYYRFRPAKFYGGIATADCVGCCLRCLFCWSWREVVMPNRYGKFYSPEDVAKQLVHIARRKGFRQVRISGNEPTLSIDHLTGVLERIPQDLLFILETNGILIGYDSGYAEQLKRFRNLHVRVSLKGTGEAEFSALTGAKPSGFAMQIRALENLADAGVSTHPAVMGSFSPLRNIQSLRKRLATIHPRFEEIEVEDVVMYGDVERRLRRADLL